MFLVSRCAIYPFHIIAAQVKYCFFPDGAPMPTPLVWWVFFGSLSTLAALHVYWGRLICLMAYKALCEAGVSDDIRYSLAEKAKMEAAAAAARTAASSEGKKDK